MRKIKPLKLELSIHAIHLLLDAIAQFIENVEDVKDSKELIWRNLLIEIHKKLMEETVVVKVMYKIKFRPYQVLALDQLLTEVDVAEKPWDAYQFHLWKKMWTKISLPLALPEV